MKNSKYNSSFANSHGITRKDLANNPSDGIGLNPNLNIQDEYIENLLKQIHFLNLEIKLVKQKQNENKGMGIMGLLNKDQQPVVDHAVQSNLKFQSMKGNLKSTVHDLETKNLRLEDQNLAVKAQKDFLQEVNKKQEQKNYENRIQVDSQLSENNERLKSMQKRYRQLIDQTQKIHENHRNLKQEYQRLKLGQKIKSLMKDIDEVLKGEQQNNDVQSVEERSKEIKTNTIFLQAKDKEHRSDRNYLQVVEQNSLLKQRLKNSEKQLYEINYKLKQKQELRKLAELDKFAEQEFKKQTNTEFQRTKTRLEQKRVEVENKIGQRKIRVEAQQDIKKLQASLTKKEKELTELKRKLETSQANFKRLRQDILKMNISLASKKQCNAKLTEQQKKLIAHVNAAEVQFNKINIQVQKDQNTLNKLQDDYFQASNRLLKLEEEDKYLTGKLDYLQKNVHLDEDMKNVKIQQLRNISYNNSTVNSTIDGLLNKWEQMRKFSTRLN